MSKYTYTQSKVIDEVTFKNTANGAVRAYLHARAELPADTFDSMLAKLHDAAYETIPFILDGKPVLEVRGFRRESQLLELLDSNDWINDKPRVHKDAEDHISWMDWLKKRTLQLSGLFYLVGDYNFFTYGRKEGHWEDMLAGVMYAGGTTSLVGYGRNDQSDRQVRDLSKKIMKHLMKEGVKLPEDHALRHLVYDKNHGIIQNIHETFQRYPSEMFNLFTGLAGACVAAAALRYKVLNKPLATMDIHEISKMRISGWLDVGLGTLTMASTAIGGLVEEKAHDPDAPKSHGVQAVLDWVRERPLTIAGAGLMLSTLCHAVSTYIDYHEAVKVNDFKRIGATKNRAMFVATNLAAEFLIALSSKGHGEGVVNDPSVDNSAIAVAAELIAKQPADMREHLIDYMGTFLGQQDMLALEDNEVKKILRQQVEAMCNNPWAKANGTLAIAPVLTMPSSRIPAQSESLWQAKMAARQAATPQLQTPA